MCGLGWSWVDFRELSILGDGWVGELIILAKEGRNTAVIMRASTSTYCTYYILKKSNMYRADVSLLVCLYST